jgi:hypothetical protein
LLEFGHVPGEAPKVVFWFRIYCGFMTAVYVLMGLGSIAFIVFKSELSGSGKDDLPEGFFLVYGIFLVALGLTLAASFAAPFFLPRKPWVWVYDIVLICVGLSSCACWPITIPLIIYWIKPEARAYFGRS